MGELPGGTFAVHSVTMTDTHAPFPRDAKTEPEAEFIDYSPSPTHSQSKDEQYMTDDDRLLANWSEADQRRLIRKVDLRLIPLCGVMYCVSLLDRTNHSNAAIAGMTVELELTMGSVDRYSIISLVFFITYTLCQPPATILCRKIGPRVFLGTITFLWGVVMIGFGLVNNWQTLIGLRLILILVGFLTLDFKRQNAKADRGEKVLEEGNEHFRYTYWSAVYIFRSRYSS